MITFLQKTLEKPLSVYHKCDRALEIIYTSQFCLCTPDWRFAAKTAQLLKLPPWNRKSNGGCNRLISLTDHHTGSHIRPGTGALVYTWLLYAHKLIRPARFLPSSHAAILNDTKKRKRCDARRVDWRLKHTYQYYTITCRRFRSSSFFLYPGLLFCCRAVTWVDLRGHVRRIAEY